MNSRLIEKPAALAVALEDAKNHLRYEVEDTHMDGMVTTWVAGIVEAAENKLGRAIISQRWRLALDAFEETISLPRPPLISVQSVRYIDTAGVMQTLSAADYMVDDISEPARLLPSAGKTWPSTAARPNAVVVDYTCGYGVSSESTPSGIKLYILAKLVEQFGPNAEANVPEGRTQLDGLLDGYFIYS